MRNVVLGSTVLVDGVDEILGKVQVPIRSTPPSPLPPMRVRLKPRRSCKWR